MSKVAISGSDPIWVNGMAKQLRDVFEKHRNWFSPISENREVRLLLSFAVVSLLCWQLNHIIWKTGVQPTLGITEYISFGICLLLLIWLVYPLSRTFMWIFPNFEFEQSRPRTVRNVFWFLLVSLVSWIIAEVIFPYMLT